MSREAMQETEVVAAEVPRNSCRDIDVIGRGNDDTPDLLDLPSEPLRNWLDRMDIERKPERTCIV